MMTNEELRNIESSFLVCFCHVCLQKAFTEGIVSRLLFVFQHLVLFDIYTVHYEI